MNNDQSGLAQIKRSWLKRLPGLIVLLFFPALVFDFSLRSYSDEVLRISHEESEAEGALQLARLNRSMHLKTLIETEVSKFALQSQHFFANTEDIAQAIDELNGEFAKKFRVPTQLFWLDGRCRIIEGKKSARIAGKSAWEKFARVIALPGKPSNAELIVANGLVKGKIGDFLDADFFKTVLREPMVIYYQGQRSVMFMRRLIHESEAREKIPRPAFLLLCLNIEKLRREWLERRALAIFARKGVLAGAMRISSSEAVVGSEISENLLFGFSEVFRSGKGSRVFAGNLYCFSTQLDNPDVFLCVAVPVRGLSGLLRLLAEWPLIWYLPFILAVFIACFFDFAVLFTALSVRTRFRLATAGLSLAPILLMVFAGLNYLAQLRSEIRQNQLSSLDTAIDRFSDSVSLQTVQLENFLRNDLSIHLARCKTLDEMAERSFSLLRDSGCETAGVMSKDGELFRRSILGEEQSKIRIAFLINLVKVPLQANGFDVKILEEFAGSAMNDHYKSDRDRRFRYDFFKNLNSIELGPTTAMFFATFVNNSAGEILAAAGIGFEAEIMRQFFLKKALKLNHESEVKVFLRPVSNVGTFYNSHSSEVDEVLRLTALTGVSFARKFTWNSRDYLVRSRLLNDVNSAAAAVTMLKKELSPLEFYLFCIFIGIFALAVINARQVFALLEEKFFKPILDLTEAVKRIRDGDYQTHFFEAGTDEIGSLKQNFNLMTRGLREKAQMKKFVNEELLSGENSSEASAFVRLRATILFCGIRNFSALEARLGAEEAFKVMNLFLSVCDEQIKKAEGKTDKFIGDTAMAFFKGKTQIDSSLRAAVAIKSLLQEKIAALNEESRFIFGIGIASGDVISGSIGSQNKRLDFTVIGDPVNLAARIEKLAGRGEGSQILFACEELSDAGFSFRDFARLKVRGKENEVRIVEVLNV